MTAPDLRVVLCTAPDAEAERLADALLAAGLCACVNLVGPVRSRYVWKGLVESAVETMLVIKTRADLVTELRATLVAHHPYELPEVLEVPVSGGLDRYLDWVAASCRS